jgi:hypothetical protein
MKTVPTAKRSRHWLVWAAAALAAVAGLKLGFDAGVQMAGTWLGVLMALNAAVFGSLIAGALVERLLGPR